MSLRKILNFFLFICIITPIIAIIANIDNIDNMRIIIAVYNLIFAISFYLLISSVIQKSNSFFTKKNLIIYGFSYILGFFLIINFTYYFDHGSFMEYTSADSNYYDKMARTMQGMDFFDSISWFINSAFKGDTEDLGGVLIPSIAYKFYTSTFSYNVFNLIAGIFIGINIYSISKNFMRNKAAFLAALTYIISSFSIYFYTTGLKETFFILIVVSSYNYFYKFLSSRSKADLIIMVLFLLSILFYRPAVLYMIIISMLLAMKLIDISVKNFVYLLVGGLAFLILFQAPISMVVERYYGSSEHVAETHGQAGFQASYFNYVVGFVSAVIGPFPSFVPFYEKEAVVIYSTGLVFRLVMSGVFIYSIFIIIIKRVKILAPILLFVLLEMFALSLILESFELRLNLPHFPFVYILSFYFLDNYIYSNKRIEIKTRWIEFGLYASLFLVVFWNFR